MKKLKLLLSISLLLGFRSVFAQSLERYVVSAQGMEMEQPSVKISWTIGEPVVDFFQNSSYMFAQGYQQLYLVSPTSTPQQQTQKEAIEIYPNPCTKGITLTFADAPKAAMRLRIFNLIGQQVYETNLISVSTYIDLSKLPTSDYIGVVTDENGKTFKTFKITKTN